MASSVPATAELQQCEADCKAAVAAVVSSLGEGSKFTDESFTCSLESAPHVLYTDEKAPGWDCTVGVPTSWHRLSDVTYGGVTLFAGGIGASDVRQGRLGDCFLLSAIASVAGVSPDLIESLFVAYDCERGVYGIRLFINGAWTWFLVDDFVGYDEEGELLFAYSPNYKEVWLPLLEKAVAKACTCFENIDGGSVAWALELLTGGKSSGEMMSVNKYETSELWDLLSTRMQRGDVIGLATGSSAHLEEKLESRGFDNGTSGVGQAGEAVLDCGLVAGHAYSLLGMVSYEGTRLYKIRNPWGAGEWTGAWSDNSPEMTDEARAVLGHRKGNDGIFFMSAEDFSLWSNLYAVRLFDSKWTLSRETGYFFQGLKLARCIKEYSGGWEELSLKLGDVVVLKQTGYGSDWWRGHLRSDANLEVAWVPSACLERSDNNASLRTYTLQTPSPAPCVLVLAQADWHGLRKFTFDQKRGANYKDMTYSNISITVTDSDGTLLAHMDATSRTVYVEVQTGAKPLKVEVADYGGEGEKYSLLCYSQQPTALDRVRSRVPEDKGAREAWALYDVSGNGLLSRSELYRVLLQLDMFPSLDEKEQQAFLEKQFSAADTDGDKQVSFDEFKVFVEAMVQQDQPQACSEEQLQEQGELANNEAPSRKDDEKVSEIRQLRTRLAQLEQAHDLERLQSIMDRVNVPVEIRKELSDALLIWKHDEDHVTDPMSRSRASTPFKPTADMTEIVKTHFKTFDANNDGVMTYSELQNMMMKLGWSQKRSLRLAQVMDKNLDGQIKVKEFMSWAFGSDGIMSLMRQADT